jgi:dipeptidyl aminopeptidase/acylaminoacyl peptidase
MLQFKRATRILLTAAMLCGPTLLRPPGALAQTLPPTLNNALVREDLASPDAIVEQMLPRYLEGRSARFIDWLGDGSMLVATRFGETEQIHRVRAALAAREQWSFEPAGVLAAAAQPLHEQSFLYLAPRAGGESTMLLLEPQAGHAAAAPLTDGHSRDGAALWAHDGLRIAFGSKRGPGTEIELIDVSVSPQATRMVAGGNDYRWRVFDWALDDARLLLGRETLAGEGEPELFIATLASGELTAVTLPHKPEAKAPRSPQPPPTPVRALSARFAPDGRGILLLGHTEGAGDTDLRQLQYLDPASGEVRALSTDSGREVELFDESADGHYLAYTSTEGGVSRLALLDQQRKLDLNIRELPPGIISSLKFDPSGKRLALTLESARAPRDVYVLEPETQLLTRWTMSELGPIDPVNLAGAAPVRFPTWDRIDGQPRVLSAAAFRPRAAPPAGTPAGPHPVLVLLRGTGGTQFRPGFDPLVQFLVNELGFVVLAPNVRSFGEGAPRDDAVRDVGSLLVWIGQQHELDYNHIMILGEGYDSSLALWCLAQYGDRLRGGIAAFPPHLTSLANIASIRRPLLLVHGRNDPDAPAYESEQLAARLRANGAPVQYLGATDEAGEFTRKSSRDAYYTAAANFLAQLIR